MDLQTCAPGTCPVRTRLEKPFERRGPATFTETQKGKRRTPAAIMGGTSALGNVQSWCIRHRPCLRADGGVRLMCTVTMYILT